MDPIGGASAIIAFLQGTATVVQAVDAAIHAPEERAIFHLEAEDLEIVLNRWIKLIEEAMKKPNEERWYLPILDVVKKDKNVFMRDGKLIINCDRKEKHHWLHRSKSSSGSVNLVGQTTTVPSKPEPDGLFTRFDSLRQDLERKTKEKPGLQGVIDRITWIRGKASAKEIQDYIRSLRQLLDELQSYIDHELHKETLMRMNQGFIRTDQGFSRMDQGFTRMDEGFSKTDQGIIGVGQQVTVLMTEMKTRASAEESKKIMNWISPLDFRAKERELLQNKFRGGKWLMEHAVFKGWKEGRPSKLECSGAPGVGKVGRSTISLQQ